MAETIIDVEHWHRAAQFHWFRKYDRPHYAITSRMDVTHLVNRHEMDDISFYRGCLFAISEGLHAGPELQMRFRNNDVVSHDTVSLSMPVPKPDGGFNYAYVPRIDVFADFDPVAARIIKETALKSDLDPVGDYKDAVAFLSCLPWLDYTSINNAMPHKNDSIPRVSWGKFVPEGDRWKMAMTLEVHHALVDGEHAGAFFNAVQDALDRI